MTSWADSNAADFLVSGHPGPPQLSNRSSHVTEGELVPLGYEQITALSASTALTVPANARTAIIQAESQSVRWRDDGTAPTTGIGMVLAAGDDVVYSGDLAEVRVIEITASAKLNISYYR